MKKHSKIILIAGIGLIIALAGVVITFFAARNQPELSAEEHYTRGETLLEKKKYTPAFEHFLNAAKKNPAQADYHWKVVKWAINLRKKNYAQKHAELAWNTGMKTKEVLLIRVDLSEFDNVGKLSYGLELLAELPEPEAHDILRGDIHFQFGQVEDSLKIYQTLFADKPSPELVSKIAKAYLRIKNSEDAFQFINDLRNTELLDTDSYHLLVTLLTYRQNFTDIEAVFSEAKKYQQYDGVLHLRHAILKLVLNKMAEGMNLMTTLLETDLPKSEIAEDSYRDVRRQAQEKLHHQTRLYLGFFYAAENDIKGIQQLISRIAEDTSRIQEGEKLFYDYLLLSQKKKDKIPNELVKAKKLLPSHAIIELATMMEENRIGNHTGALISHKKLFAADQLTAFIPTTVLQYAEALSGSGQVEEAIYLLNELHTKRNIYSKRSVSLLRTYTQLAQMPEESWKLQELLFDQYGDDIDVQFSGGRLALSLGKWSKALEIFNNLAEKYPEEVQFKIAGIEVLLKKGDYEGVLTACKNSDAPKELLASFEALAHKELGQFNEAEIAFETAMGGESSENLHVEYGFLLYQLGKLKRSRELLEGVLRRNPQDAGARLGMAFIAFRNGNLSEARAILNPLISENENMLLARLKMTEIDLAENKPEVALSGCRYVLQRNPEMPYALFLEGTCLRRLNRPVEAETALERCLENSPDDTEIAIQLALTRQSLKKYDEALALIDRELQREPENKGLKRIRFNLLCLLKRFPDALQELEKLKPLVSAVEVTHNSAWLLEQQGRNTEAIKLLAENLGEPSLALYWAKLTLINGQVDAILPKLKKYELDKDFWTELGHFAVAKNLPYLAVKCYRRAIDLGSSDPFVFNNFAWYAMEQESNNQDEVLSAIQRAYELEPAHTNIMDTYATALIHFGRYDECIAILEEKRKIIRYNSGLLMHLAKAYEAVGNLPKAIENYSRILDTKWGEDANFDPNALKEHIQHLKQM